MTALKTGCYHCVHRRSVPGSAHSECVHPRALSPAALLHFLAFAEFPPLELRFDLQAIRLGYVMWPKDFDPVWLKNCAGFTPKEEPRG